MGVFDIKYIYWSYLSGSVPLTTIFGLTQTTLQYHVFPSVSLVEHFIYKYSDFDLRAQKNEKSDSFYLRSPTYLASLVRTLPDSIVISKLYPKVPHWTLFYSKIIDETALTTY